MTAGCPPSHGHLGDGICDPCTDQLIGELTDLPELWKRLHDGLTPTQRTPFVSGSRAAGGWSAPINVAVHDHATRITTTLTQWAAGIAQQRRITPPTNQPDFAFHTRNATWAAGRTWAGRYAGDIHRLWAPAMGLTQSWPAPPDHAVGVPCTRCDRMTLYRTPGHDGWRCEANAGGCGHWLAEVTYRQIVNTRAAVARQPA